MKLSVVLAVILVLLMVGSLGTAFAMVGPWYQVTNFTPSTFANAISTLGSTPASLLISSSWTVASNVTVPSNIQLVFTQGGQLNIKSGYVVYINGSVEAPMAQIFSGAGLVAFGANRSIKEVYPQWWGALANGSNDDAPAIQAAVNSLSNGGTVANGGTVYLPAGTYLIDETIEMMYGENGVKLCGAGMQATTINNNVPVNGNPDGGPAVEFFSTTNDSVSDLTIRLSANGTIGTTGVLLYGRAVAWCMMNYIYNLDIMSAGVDIAGQTGILLDGDTPGNSETNDNHVFNINIYNVAQPIVLPPQGEANIFSMATINEYGVLGGAGTGVTMNANDDQFSDMWFGKYATSSSPAHYAFSGSGDGDLIHCFADIGTNGFLVSLTGDNNEVFGRAIYPAGIGSIGASGYHEALGRERDASGYELNEVTDPGANRSLFQAGVLGYTNGFTVNYQDSPQYMSYTFLNGNIGIGFTPASYGWPGLQLMGGISGTTTPAENLRGTVTISGTNMTAAVPFSAAEADANYFATATVNSITGTPSLGSKIVYISGKSTTGFTIDLGGAPGVGSSVTVDWIMVR